MKRLPLMALALVLTVIGSIWLLTRRSTQPEGGLSAGGVKPQDSALTSAQAGTSAGSEGTVTTASPSAPVGAAKALAENPALRVDPNAPVDPAQAAAVSQALTELKALYQPVGSLGWDEAKALIAKREQATKELAERLGRLGQGGARAMAAAFSQADSMREKLLLVQGLGKVDDTEAAGYLQSLLERDPSFSMRKEVVVALGQRGDSAAESLSPVC
jgi:hypothetical protein